MAFQNNIEFTLGQGGLQTPQPGTDYVSGIVFVSATLPSGFSYSTAQEVLSLVQAQSLGIVGNFADETAATAHITISATGAAGSTTAITVVEPSVNGTYNTVSIGTYTLTSSDASGTINSLASNISNFINTQYATTGYSAGTPTGASFSITARVGLGTIINGTTPTIVNTGYSGVSAASFSGGINSVRMAEWYQISEYFRMNPNGVLWVDYESSYSSFNCLNVVQQQSGNLVNQFGVYNIGATTSAQITTDLNNIQSVAKTMFQPGYAPAVVLYAPNLYNYGSNLATLSNLRNLNDNYCSCIIEQDGNALGAWLSLMYNASVPAYGNILGLVSSGNVSQDIGNPQNFNQVSTSYFSFPSELSMPAFSNKQLFSYLFSTNFNLLSQLDSYGYIFGTTRANLSGTFVNDDHSCISITSNYAYIDRNRVINKAARLLYASLAPLINSSVIANSNGTISAQAIAIFNAAAKPNLDSMISNNNISAYPINPNATNSPNGLYINPAQNIVSTSTVAVTLNIVPIGIARSIQVTLGFSL